MLKQRNGLTSDPYHKRYSLYRKELVTETLFILYMNVRGRIPQTQLND
jgi:hypothetical protein